MTVKEENKWKYAPNFSLVTNTFKTRINKLFGHAPVNMILFKGINANPIKFFKKKVKFSLSNFLNFSN